MQHNKIVHPSSNFEDDEEMSPQKKGNSKGLRHFSARVCEKLANLRVTTYNEIANMLVKDFSESFNTPVSLEFLHLAFPLALNWH